ncbi:MAG: hypothetical protein IH861_14465 [Chloroflexi bacterium]|nr:hypothetical protein [Chloroflexota bacterium]
MLQDYFRDVPNNLCPSCVKEWDSWLGELSDSRERKRITADLKKVGDTEFHSSHLELYFHHMFRNKGFDITWHPTLKGVGTHPEFLLRRNGESFLFEARISDQEKDFRGQEDFRRLLKPELEKLGLLCLLTVESDQIAPPISMFDVVKEILIQFIQREFEIFHEENVQEKYTYCRFPLRGSQYGFDFTFEKLPDDFPDMHSRVYYFVDGFPKMRNKLFQIIEEKASRYGKPNQPFVIGIEALNGSYQTDEKGALYGSPSLRLLRDSEGNVVDTEETNTNDGIFYSALEGRLNYRHVSAVAFYQYLSGGEHHTSTLRIYHNPFATNPVHMSIFAGYPQFVPIEEGTDKGRMDWATASSTD